MPSDQQDLTHLCELMRSLAIVPSLKRSRPRLRSPKESPLRRQIDGPR